MSRKVLVIDDDSFIRTVVGMALAGSEWTVLQAATGAEGLSLAGSEGVDAILLDVVIPDLSGPEIFERLKADPATSQIPVVFLSAATETTDELMASGARGVIAKPFDPMSFGERFAASLEEK